MSLHGTPVDAQSEEESLSQQEVKEPDPLSRGSQGIRFGAN